MEKIIFHLSNKIMLFAHHHYTTGHEKKSLIFLNYIKMVKSKSST